MPSSRDGLDSNSSFHTSLASRARTFINPLCGPLLALASEPGEDLLGRPIGRAILQQLFGQRAIFPEGQPRLPASKISYDLSRFVLEALLGQLLSAAARLEIAPVVF